MPQRIQRKRMKGWRMPPNTRCVTRPGKFGNPFETAAEFRTVLQACVDGDGFSDIVRRCGDVNPGLLDLNHMMRIARDLGELRGLNLACFCLLDKECHADVLIEYANPEGVKDE